MPGLLSYSYDDLKNGKIQLRENGTWIPPEDSGAVFIRVNTKALSAGKEITWNALAMEGILSCFPKISSNALTNQRSWKKDLIVRLNRHNVASQMNDLVFRVKEMTRVSPVGPMTVWMQSEDQQWKFSIAISKDNIVAPTSILQENANAMLNNAYDTVIGPLAAWTGHFVDPLGRYNFEEQHELALRASQSVATLNSNGTKVLNNLVKSKKLVSFVMALNEDAADIVFELFTFSEYIWVTSDTSTVGTPHEYVFENSDKTRMIVIRTSSTEILWAAYIDKTIT